MILLLLYLADFVICDKPTYQVCPNTIFADSIYYVFWSDLGYPDPPSIYASRVRTDGSVIDSVGRILYQGNPTFGARVAFDGQNFLAVFRDSC
ncbi:MAG TPA: hypothetical protein EYP58_06335 [bacterium (Candidatus Stahlbacteria)]|nr:hypothetical protein [Candidatus Stahlbacteria bacterium]